MINGPLEGDFAGKLVADLVEKILQEEGTRLGQEEGLLGARAELKSILVVDNCQLLQSPVKLA